MTNPVVVVARWETTPESLATVLAHAAEVSPLSLAEPGCLGYELLQSLDQPTTILLIERYADHTALEAHLNSPHYQELVAGKIRPLLTSRQVDITTGLAP
ncbi:putative quinol monooxygenase [Mycolicibacterium sp. CBMA 226]|uniref:putative quinol monooxygenase n=1 Tax=Mycolicibacterium sp. CBMA 226 TaxID=2606611 RepID=UPI0012DF662F|nr:putative quinol monooxygenase [Mycolicibacterium sp. CBMA 226]MUL74954.1 antibiotic biosynthesis monooxygenase [Mycolicibacterium sp. CBMA 226]